MGCLSAADVFLLPPPIDGYCAASRPPMRRLVLEGRAIREASPTKDGLGMP